MGQKPNYISTDPDWGNSVDAEMSAQASAGAAASESDSGAIAMRGAAGLVRPVANAVTNMATSPTLPKTTGAAARAATTLGALGHGAATGNMTEVIAAPMAGWTAGKGGYWLGKLLQQHLLMPAAKVAETLAPYATTLAKLSGAQAALDLAQMAEPNRKDIGFLGIGKTQDKAAQKAFSDAWDNWMATYPRSVGKERWSALKPSERKEAFDQFMQTQTKAGNE